MKKFKIKKLLRLGGLLCLLLLALLGIGVGPIFSGQKEPYRDHQIQTELVETKEEDEEDPLKPDTKR